MKTIAALALILFATPASAALPPWAQAMEDLQVMVNFIAEHNAVAESLRLIDMGSHTIHYGEDCVIQFKRGEVEEAMPGPAPDLEFESSSCELKN
jgi:hypothetical protein